jgi:hypothetical protein
MDIKILLVGNSDAEKGKYIREAHREVMMGNLEDDPELKVFPISFSTPQGDITLYVWDCQDDDFLTWKDAKGVIIMTRLYDMKNVQVWKQKIVQNLGPIPVVYCVKVNFGNRLNYEPFINLIKVILGPEYLPAVPKSSSSLERKLSGLCIR